MPARTLPAIPTYYEGVRFRSRLEARWAAFFDALGWAWDYEPIDLNAYIPDFILRYGAAEGREPVIVECKPFIDPCNGDAQAVAEFCTRIADAWYGSALLVGSVLFPETVSIPHRTATLLTSTGTLREAQPQPEPIQIMSIGRARPDGMSWSDAYLRPTATEGGAWSLSTNPQALTSTESAWIKMAWAEAGNKTQWRGRK